jgi:hypothetical protein
VVVLVPAEAFAGAEPLGDLGHGPQRRDGEQERAGQVRRALLVREGEGLLLRERVAAAGRVVLDVLPRGLRVEPLADVALVGARALGQFAGGQRPPGQSLVQTQPLADDDEAGVERGAEVRDELPQQLIELLLVDCHKPPDTLLVECVRREVWCVRAAQAAR